MKDTEYQARARAEDVLDDNELASARRAQYDALFREVMRDIVGVPSDVEPTEVEWLFGQALTSELWGVGRQSGRLARVQEMTQASAAEQRRLALAEASERKAIRGHHYDAFDALVGQLKAVREVVALSGGGRSFRQLSVVGDE